MSKTKSLQINLDWKDLTFVIATGISLTLIFGFFENMPGVYIGRYIKLYGYPVTWRYSEIALPDTYSPLNLLIDFVFWIALFFMLIALFEGISKK